MTLIRDISKHFCLLPVFLRRLSFSRKGINFRSAFWHEYPWIHSCIHPSYIFVDKTFKLLNYNNTSCVYYRLHCRFMKYSSAGQIFLKVMLVALCCRVFAHLASTRKYLPQFRVSILRKNYEGRSSLKTQLKIEFLQKCLITSLVNLTSFNKRVHSNCKPATSLLITSFANQLATSLLTTSTCNILIIHKLLQAMGTHPDIGFF